MSIDSLLSRTLLYQVTTLKLLLLIVAFTLRKIRRLVPSSFHHDGLLSHPSVELGDLAHIAQIMLLHRLI